MTDKMVIGYTRDRRGRVKEHHLNALSNTLNRGGGSTTQYLIVPAVLRMERTVEEKVRRSIYGDADAKFSQSRLLAPRTDGLSNTISTVLKDNRIFIPMENKTFRIRKFTPRECFRLMGVSEKDIDTIQAAGISKSQQYKMAGNSIVVDVLDGIFRKMFTDSKPDELFPQDLFAETRNYAPPQQFSNDHPLRVCTAFSGYDSQCMALDRQVEHDPNFAYDLVAWSEIDRFAIEAHNAIYPQYANRNLGDISKIDWESAPDFDLFTYSFPCTDISSAGLQKGLSENSGTRSGLLWECRKAIDAKRPRFLLMENVAALTQKKFMPEFVKWQDYLKSRGYTNFWKILNAKDYGIPQNRPRVFMVSMLDQGVEYSFPSPFPLTKRIKDVIEPVVDECYYISEDRLKGLNLSSIKQAENGNGFRFVPKNEGDTANSVTSKAGSRKTDNFLNEDGLHEGY